MGEFLQKWKERRAFKGLFDSQKMVKITSVLAECDTTSAEELGDKLEDWGISEYYEMTGGFVRRNDTPTKWDKIKKKLKKAGKFALTKAVPVAIGMATGGAGLGAALAPVVSEVVGKLKERGLSVSEESELELRDVLLNKTDVSLDTLMDKIRRGNRGRGMDPDKLERVIRMSIKEDLHPILAEIQAVLGELQEEQAHILDIFEEWMSEQRTRIEDFQARTYQRFDLTLDSLSRIEQQMAPQLEEFREQLKSIDEGVQEANRRLYTMEDQLDLLYREICREGLEDLSLDELMQVSRIQFQNIRLAGKFDKPYNEQLFIDTPSLQRYSSRFLRERTTTTPVFLLLAGIGMGKTWNAVHLGIKSRELSLAIPFFIPIHMGYSGILQDIFQIRKSSMAGLAQIIGEKCDKVYERLGKPVLFILDGVDEYPTENRSSFLNFLRHIIQGYKNSVRILLTDRIIDWNYNKQLRGFYREINPFIFENGKLQGVRNFYNISTKLSAFLDGFNNKQLDKAITKYGLDKSKFSPGLYELCHRPYILRIVYEKNQYFDPDDIDEFWEVFYNRINPINTILDRMGISRPNDLLFPLFKEFGNANATKTEAELSALISRDKIDWEVILRSGLINIEQSRFQTIYSINDVFRPLVNDYLKQTGMLHTQNLESSKGKTNLIQEKGEKEMQKNIKLVSFQGNDLL
ncbi:MAG: hypothetical protein ACOC4M_18310, partial [Promethearchaeia archaeon]